MQAAAGERLSDFLYRVGQDLNLLDLWRLGGASAVLEREGGNLRAEHLEVLGKGDLKLISLALEEEASLGNDDVSLHQHGHIGPCWVLVG